MHSNGDLPDGGDDSVKNQKEGWSGRSSKNISRRALMKGAAALAAASALVSTVATLMGMPSAKGLFHRAVVESGTAHLRVATADDAARPAAPPDSADGPLLVGTALNAMFNSIQMHDATLESMTTDKVRKRLSGRIFVPSTQRIYAVCGGGHGEVDVYKETDPNHYDLVGKVPSRYFGKTGVLVTQIHRFFVGVPNIPKHQFPGYRPRFATINTGDAAIYEYAVQ